MTRCAHGGVGDGMGWDRVGWDVHIQVDSDIDTTLFSCWVGWNVDIWVGLDTDKLLYVASTMYKVVCQHLMTFSSYSIISRLLVCRP